MNCENGIRALLAQIDARDAQIGAWAFLDREAALMQARALDAGTWRGALHGTGIGVKDVIDTADMPTVYNSPIYAGYRPERDAEVVRLLKAAGAIIMGKTVTTEFAFMEPGRTRNPHNLDCTPGGSSSGSAAAVAAGMVPVALTTQTGGSTIRPAAYCGVIGYKPAFNRYPTRGLKPLAPSLDTIGLHARNLDDLARVSRVLAMDAVPVAASPATPSFALVRTHNDGQAEPQAIRRLEEVGLILERAGASVRKLELPALFAELEPLHRVIMSAETARSFAREWESERDRLSATLTSLIAEGLAHGDAEVAGARGRVEEGKRLMDTLLLEGELMLTLPAAGEAPVGLASTGTATFNRLWTLLGVACITVPAGRGVRGLPLGVQLVARNGDATDGTARGRPANGAYAEAELLAGARWLQHALAGAGLALGDEEYPHG